MSHLVPIIIEGLENATLLLPEKVQTQVLRALGSVDVMHLRNLAVVDVVIGRATMKLRGAAQALLARLSERSINVIEALTCAGELLVVIHESDLQRSVEALAIAKSRTSHV